MANELTKAEESLLSTINSNDLGTLIKPLVNEIHLFDSFIAGTSYVDSNLFAAVKTGDGLLLRREDNRFDEHAIMILNEDGKKLGYVPEKDNIVFARLMDAGKCLKAKVIEVKHRGSYNMVSIGIYLVDF